MGILRNIFEVFKTLKYRGLSKIYCPRCGSPRIHLSSSLDYWLTPKSYVCDECGYRGPIIMELEEDEGKTQNVKN